MVTETRPGLQRETLNAIPLMEAASREASLEDYGDRDRLTEDLTRWLNAVAAEAGLNAMGVAAVEQNVIRVLVNCLRFQEDLAKHPEVLEEVVADPIVVIGLPRTGTSKLQRMMSSTPEMQKLAFWRLLNPAPVGPGEPDPRIAIARQYVDFVKQVPDIMAAHPFTVEDADEDALMLEMTFRSLFGAFRVRVPSYLAWHVQSPQLPNYEYLHRLLQYLQWQDGGRRDRPWVLKSPYHLGNLDSLMATFPDATIVHCHRDPAVVVPSFCRLIEVFRQTTSDHIDLAELGAEILAYLSGETAKHLAQRESMGATVPILDVQYEEIKSDPLAVIRQVYSMRGQELSADAAENMKRWEATNPKDQHGAHAYSLERYSLTTEAIEAEFAQYRSRFIPKRPRVD